ncbi:hypothetical protein NPIL_139451, partial [Nephila pilipes]
QKAHNKKQQIKENKRHDQSAAGSRRGQRLGNKENYHQADCREETATAIERPGRSSSGDQEASDVRRDGRPGTR